MLPNFRSGQLVIARRLRRPTRKGDVIIFMHDFEKIKRVANVTEEGIFVLGDNAKRSTDSRHFGPIQQKDIIGVVIMPIWSRRGLRRAQPSQPK